MENSGQVTFMIEKLGSNERSVTALFSTIDGSAFGKYRGRSIMLEALYYRNIYLILQKSKLAL